MAGNDDELFATPRFRGDRFEERKGEMPVEALQALKTYRELILEVARALYGEKFHLQRVPKQAFEEAFQLNLTGIGEGSAINNLARHYRRDPAAFETFGDKFGPWLAAGRDLVTTAVGAANDDKPLPANFPEHLVPKLMELVAPLNPGESLELATPAQQVAPRVTHATVEKLARRPTRPHVGERELNGQIVAVNTVKHSFIIRLTDGLSLDGEYSPVHDNLFKRALGRNSFVRLHMKAGVLLGPEDDLLKVSELYSVSAWTRSDEAAVTKIEARIEALKTLTPGWLNGHGVVVDPSELDWGRQFLLRLMVDHGVPIPRLFPIEEGGIRAEWSAGPWEVSLDIHLPAREGWVHAAHMDDEAKDRDDTFNLMKAEKALVEFLSSTLPIATRTEVD